MMMDCPSCGNPVLEQGDVCSCLGCGCVFESQSRDNPGATDPILVCVCGKDVKLQNYGVNFTQWQGRCECGMPWHVEEVDEAALESIGDEEEDDAEAMAEAAADYREAQMDAYNPNPAPHKTARYTRYRQRPPSHFMKGKFRTVPIRHTDAPKKFKRLRRKGVKAVVGKLKPEHKIPGPRGGRRWATQSVLVPNPSLKDSPPYGAKSPADAYCEEIDKLSKKVKIKAIKTEIRKTYSDEQDKETLMWRDHLETVLEKLQKNKKLTQEDKTSIGQSYENMMESERDGGHHCP